MFYMLLLNIQCMLMSTTENNDGLKFYAKLPRHAPQQLNLQFAL